MRVRTLSEVDVLVYFPDIRASLGQGPIRTRFISGIPKKEPLSAGKGDMPVSNTDVNFDIEDNHGHVPVMRSRMAELIAPAVEAAGDNAVIVDGTLGAGGHTEF